MRSLTRCAPRASLAASSSSSASSLLRTERAMGAARRLFSSAKAAAPVTSTLESACTPLAPPDYTTGIQFVAHRETFPVYRIMDDEGEVLDASQLPEARPPPAISTNFINFRKFFVK
jgi:hypothetical protein